MSQTKTNLTLKQRQRLQGKVQPEQKATSDKRISRIVALLLLLLAFGGGTALGMIYFRPDPRIEELEDMRVIMADANTPNDVRRDLGGQLGELADELPASVRQRAGMDRGGARMARFFAMSSADQLALLEQQAAREKEREALRAEQEAEAAAKPADSSQANSNGKSSNNGGGRRGGGTDQQRVQRQEQRLSNSTPQQRSQGTLMHQMTNAVRQQQGLAVR